MNRFTKLASIVLTASALVSVAGVVSADQKTAGGGTGTQRASSSKTLEVNRLVFARGIDGHEPQDAATSFSAKEDRVYAFVELANPGTDDNIEVVFVPPSGVSFAVPLKVSGGAAHFRTWAFTRKAHDAGEWTVIVRDSGNKVLARQTFVVTK
jgi:hypothetical protein